MPKKNFQFHREQGSANAQSALNLAKEMGTAAEIKKAQSEVNRYKNPKYIGGTHAEHYKKGRGKQFLTILAIITIGSFLMAGCSEEQVRKYAEEHPAKEYIGTGAFDLQAPPVQNPPSDDAPITVENVLAFINSSRAAEGHYPLKINTILNKVAESDGKEIIRTGEWEHPKTAMKDKRFVLIATERHYKWSRLGENLAHEFKTAKGQNDAWMKSETHRFNIMLPEFREIGISIQKFKGKNLTVTIFGAEP